MWLLITFLLCGIHSNASVHLLDGAEVLCFQVVRACVHACMPRWEHSWVGLPLSSSYVIGLVFIKFMYLPCFYFTATGVRSDLLFSRPRSDGWSHHGRTFSIYPYPLSF